jgi:hypothetical protein
MKNDEPGNQDESLHKVLQAWRTDAPLPPRFQEAVWGRINRAPATATPTLWTLVSHWLGSVLPRPALATVYVAMLLAVGGTVGWTQARQENARVKEELGWRYVRSLNPYQSPRL